MKNCKVCNSEMSVSEFKDFNGECLDCFVDNLNVEIDKEVESFLKEEIK